MHLSGIMIDHKADSTMALGRDTSNQSTVDSGSGQSMISHPDQQSTDPNARRMFGLSSTTGADMQRRLRLIIDQCETVRFPFKKRLILANLSLSHDDIPVQDICSERMGSALYKLSLAGNQILSIPEPLVLKLTGLRVLDVSQCGLRSLPDVWDLPSLRKLVVSHNRIQVFPAEVSSACISISSRPPFPSMNIFNHHIMTLSNNLHFYLLIFTECFSRPPRVAAIGILQEQGGQHSPLFRSDVPSKVRIFGHGRQSVRRNSS